MQFTIPKPIGRKEHSAKCAFNPHYISLRNELKAVASSPAMRITRLKTPFLRRLLGLSSVRRLHQDEDGATAVEFAIVSTPFLMFIFALVGCAIYFFMMNSVEKGMDQSSRLIRTGQAVSSKLTVNQFKQKICDGAGNWINCSKLQIFVSHYPDWGSVAPEPCIKDNVVIQNPAPGNDAHRHIFGRRQRHRNRDGLLRMGIHVQTSAFQTRQHDRRVNDDADGDRFPKRAVSRNLINARSAVLTEKALHAPALDHYRQGSRPRLPCRFIWRGGGRICLHRATADVDDVRYVRNLACAHRP